MIRMKSTPHIGSHIHITLWLRFNIPISFYNPVSCMGGLRLGGERVRGGCFEYMNGVLQPASLWAELPPRMDIYLL
jgi:hypothetical protein